MSGLNPARRFAAALLMCGMATSGVAQPGSAQTTAAAYDALPKLFADWRAFEASGVLNGAPDYTAAAMARKQAELVSWHARLATVDRTGWQVSQKVDYHLIRAEMNGLDFDLRVLKPWQRDPAFYATVWDARSDTPAHEGPVLHRPIELWTYAFPLDAAAERKLTAELRTIPPLLAQARGNLTGNARDLWEAGIMTVDAQVTELDSLAGKTSGGSAPLRKAVANARAATKSFADWLRTELPSKTGPSGVGKANYDWYLRNVQLSPLTWEGEVAILQRELGRAHAALRLEENRNRDLPPLAGADSPAAYDAQAKAAVTNYLDFLRDKRILTVRDYMKPALLAQIGSYVPPDRQDFFRLAMHRAPMTLWTHFYHWFDLANAEADPLANPIRRQPLLYNIWVSRAEGQATAMEEAMLHAGLFDATPRQREVVWIMQAQRAARGLASLYAHANIIDMKQAREFQVARTPNGWMSPHLGLLAFEQQTYMRQPGYGPSYITGKHQMDKLFAERAETEGASFFVKRFYDDLNGYGMIPVSLIRWQMLGKDDEVRAMGLEP